MACSAFPNAAGAQLPGAWTEPARMLAGKIAASVKPSRTISLEVKNISSLGAADADAIQNVLKAELLSAGVRLGSGVEVDVTLSENVEGFVWVAEISKSGAREVAMVAAPKPGGATSGEFDVRVAMSRKIIREQAANMLDFAFAPSPTGGTADLEILEPERVAVYVPNGNGWNFQRGIPITHSAPWPRYLTGRIDVPSAKILMAGVNCEMRGETAESYQCGAAPTGGNAPKAAEPEKIEIEGRSVDGVTLRAACATSGPILLAAGAGDWTQPDTLRAYKISGAPPVAVSQPIEFPGPILALWPSDDGRAARVISRNLQTGMYEASIVSVTCDN